MSFSTPPVGTNSAGQAETGTSGSSIGNNSATSISTNEFLDLMLTSLQDQDPLDPSSSDPTQYLTELAQMTGVEQETNTAQNTQDAAQSDSVSQAIAIIGDSVTYQDQQTGASITGTVSSVQITSSGPTLTINGVAGVTLGTITNVTAQPAAGTGSTDSGADSDTDERRVVSDLINNPALLPPGGAVVAPAQTPTRPGTSDQVTPGQNAPVTGGPSFASVLEDQKGVSNAPTFSKHAMERLNRRGVDMNNQTLGRLTNGIQRAADKGARNSVVFVDGTAFVTSVQNNTVITAVTPEAMNSHVFTNIDSAVIA